MCRTSIGNSSRSGKFLPRPCHTDCRSGLISDVMTEQNFSTKIDSHSNSLGAKMTLMGPALASLCLKTVIVCLPFLVSAILNSSLVMLAKTPALCPLSSTISVIKKSLALVKRDWVISYCFPSPSLPNICINSQTIALCSNFRVWSVLIFVLLSFSIFVISAIFTFVAYAFFQILSLLFKLVTAFRSNADIPSEITKS